MPDTFVYAYQNSASNTEVVWQVWAQGSDAHRTNYTTASSGAVWGNWVNLYSQNLTYPTDLTYTHPESGRALAERARVEQERVAAAKAEELLMRFLSDAQKSQYKEHGYFETDVDDRKYRITRGWSGNVYLVKGGKAVSEFCIHHRDFVPVPDLMLAQLLLLKNNEAEFLRIANQRRC